MLPNTLQDCKILSCLCHNTLDIFYFYPTTHPLYFIFLIISKNILVLKAKKYINFYIESHLLYNNKYDISFFIILSPFL